MIASALLLLVSQVTVVQTQGEVRLDGRPVEAGEVMAAPAQLSTGDLGWTELWWGNDCRIYLSAGSQLSVGESGAPRLLAGRAWVLYSKAAPAPLRFRGRGEAVAMAPGSSAVVEQHPRRGLRIAQSRGQTRLGGATVKPGQVALQEADGWRIYQGGQGLFELVATERRQALEDPTELTAFLRQEATSVRPGRTRQDDHLPSLREGRPVEDALRPPPFFEDEVPPRGPNVEVTVDYEE